MKYQKNSFRNRSAQRLLAVFTLAILTSLLVLTSGKTAPLGESTSRIEIEPECQDGAVGICTLNGKLGKRRCVMGHWGECELKDSTTITQGVFRPKYYILSVIYAPPGTNGGNSQSSVTYGTESSMGTTVSATKSFKEDKGVSLTVEGNSGVVSGKLGFSYAVGQNSSNTNSLEIKKTTRTTLHTDGTDADGINHDDDVIYLWLNPTIDVAVTATSVDCALRTDKTAADVQFAYVGWLKNPSEIPKGLRDRFNLYGITEQDFPEMLKADPFADGSTKIDRNRFQIIGETFPYLPPRTGKGAMLPKQVDISYQTEATNSSTVENETKVALTAEAGVGTPALKATLKFDESWTWTNKDTRATNAVTSEKASATVGGPAFGYTGPTDVAVYYDVLYKTFMFAFVEDKLDAFHGNVSDALGKPVSWKQVVVTSQGKRYRTYTDANGDYRVFGQISGPVRIRVGKTIRRLRRVPATRTIPVKLRA
ncbi:MAG TPA: carboxypeptidase-like regulatory domain-containing protein [Pyrinomonadaceae bacterium]|nr:carboxypeptidase-like regulatory domain-containing protein [Pyrinomonadaceae bacterium]